MRELGSLLLSAGALLAVGCGDGGGEAAPAVRLVDPAEAAALIDVNAGDQDFVILDVRTPTEHGDGHIEGAVNVDFYSADFESQLDALDRSKTYLVYCRSGARSAQATASMEGLGFTAVYELDGGIQAWTDAGYPVVT